MLAAKTASAPMNGMIVRLVPIPSSHRTRTWQRLLRSKTDRSCCVLELVRSVWRAIGWSKLSGCSEILNGATSDTWPSRG